MLENLFLHPKRIFLLLAVFLLLFACACGAEEQPTVSMEAVSAETSSAGESLPASSDDSSAESSLPISEAPSLESDESDESEDIPSEEISEEVSEELSEDSSEEPSLPPEISDGKGTLTQLDTFKVGYDGIFHYGICCSRTAFPAEINTPVIHGADGKGEIYVFWNQKVTRLSDGASFAHDSQALAFRYCQNLGRYSSIAPSIASKVSCFMSDCFRVRSRAEL